MKQYIDLLKAIEAKGTDKPAARPNMPGSRSLFGYQFRHDLSEGFPLLTTKKMYWKGIVAELLWFLRGDTNIKYLVDNGVNIWNGDAYNYYLKKCIDQNLYSITFEGFIDALKTNKTSNDLESVHGGILKNYEFGDCGYQYGRVWRNWQGEGSLAIEGSTSVGNKHFFIEYPEIDQIKNVIQSLTENPESRRHIVTAIDPAHDTDLALYWCHSMFQFNCRPITTEERYNISDGYILFEDESDEIEWKQMPYVYSEEIITERLDYFEVPKYYLDCQLYQRSADSVLGVPFNIASYALLTHIIAKLVNMVPGEFIHSFGDAHVYDNHKEALADQLAREPGKLPELRMESAPFINYKDGSGLDTILHQMNVDDFSLIGYEPKPAIKAELSTG